MSHTEVVGESIILGGGCFWCLEAAFSRCKGVKQVISGYSGGARPNPSYDQVCTGVSGHAEVIKIIFDDKEISPEDVLHIFFAIHDPTTLNKQGNDVGTQYRSVVFYDSYDQFAVVKKVINEMEDQNVFDKPVITEIKPLNKFYPAEEYHQKYYDKNPDQAYCQAVVAPKIAKFRQKYARFYK